MVRASSCPARRAACSRAWAATLPAQGWLVGMAIKAKNDELGRALQQALDSLRGSGELLAIFKQHGLSRP